MKSDVMRLGIDAPATIPPTVRHLCVYDGLRHEGQSSVCPQKIGSNAQPEAEVAQIHALERPVLVTGPF